MTRDAGESGADGVTRRGVLGGLSTLSVAGVADGVAAGGRQTGEPVYRDDFSRDTLSEYAVDQYVSGKYEGVDGSVRHRPAADAVHVHAPENITMSLSRRGLDLPERGRVRFDFDVLREYPVTNDLRVVLVEDENNRLAWRTAGIEYENSVELVSGGRTVATDTEPGTVGPGEGYTVVATWRPDRMALWVDGERRVVADGDTTSVSPSTLQLRVFQADARLQRVTVTRTTATDTPTSAAPASATERATTGSESGSGGPGLPEIGVLGGFGAMMLYALSRDREDTDDTTDDAETRPEDDSRPPRDSRRR
jgi:hypothetical protein